MNDTLYIVEQEVKFDRYPYAAWEKLTSQEKFVDALKIFDERRIDHPDARIQLVERTVKILRCTN